VSKGKRKRARELGIVTTEAPVAERHGFDGGILGHDSTYAVNVTEHVALGIDTVLACVRTIADLTADAMVGEYQGTERLDVESRIVRRPWATITRRTWIWTIAATMALYNGCYLRRRFGRDLEGVPFSLEPLAPSRVSWLNPATVRIDGQPAQPDELVWIPRMTFPTLTRELASIMRLAREAFAAAAAADRYRSGFWESGGAPGIYITTDQDISGTDADKIRDRYVERRTTKPGEPPVFGKGAKLESLGTDLASENASRATSSLGTSIARYFGMPPWLVNVPSEAGSLTYANAGAAGLDLVRYTLQPGYAGPIADAWSDELPGDPGDFLLGRHVVLDLGHLTRGTILEQFQAYAIATGSRPWLLPSEVRSDLHLPIDMTLDESGAPAPALEQIGVST
jgi:HK97 family phage portal protein